MAQTTPTGRAISVMPVAGSSAITPTDLAPCRSRSRPSVLRWFLRDLVGDVADAGVGHRQLGQLAVARRLHDGPAGGRDQLVDARLVVAVGDALRGARALHQRAVAQRREAIERPPRIRLCRSASGAPEGRASA